MEYWDRFVRWIFGLLDTMPDLGPFENIAGLVVIFLVLKLFFGFFGAFMRVFNRFTWNILPKTWNLIVATLSLGIGLIYIVAVLAGYSTGYFALYKAGDLLIHSVSTDLQKVKVEGKIIDADNRPNMSEAIVEYKTKSGEVRQFKYTATYNGTTFHVGDKVPVYYVLGESRTVQTINNKGPYVAIAFLLIYGLAVGGGGTIIVLKVIRSVRASRRKEKRAKAREKSRQSFANNSAQLNNTQQNEDAKRRNQDLLEGLNRREK